MAAEPTHCARCQRPAPALKDDAFSYWEAIGDGDEIICPGCLTRLEERGIAEDMEELGREAQLWRQLEEGGER